MSTSTSLLLKRPAVLSLALAALLVGGIGDRGLVHGRAQEPAPGAQGSTVTDVTAAVARPKVIIVVGAEGEAEYGTDFAAQARVWSAACQRAGATPLVIGPGERETPAGERPGAASSADGAVSEKTDFERLREQLAAEPKEEARELWLVMIGHGTFDGKEARFNLRGPDMSATELADWLKPFKRRLAVIDTASASAPFLAKLSGPDRVVISATRNGYEQNYTRFGRFLAEAVASPVADLDKDGQTSLLEAFLNASRNVREFYKTEGRLATEHALLDDNGDGLGTPADFFKGVRAVKAARDGAEADGIRAHQWHLVRSTEEQQLTPAARARRDELELSIAKLRDRKPKMKEEAYYQELEAALLELARLYARPADGT